MPFSYKGFEKKYLDKKEQIGEYTVSEDDEYVYEDFRPLTHLEFYGFEKR